MKKIAAILFFAVLAFNWFGYRFVINYMEARHAEAIESMLDLDDYDDAELISIKAPFSVPYFSNSNRFERWNGELELDGVIYKYVKRRFFKDSIEVLCLPDYRGTGLESAKDNFFRLANDLVQHQPEKKSDNHPTSAHKNLLTNVFCQEMVTWDFGLDLKANVHHARYASFASAEFEDNKGQPPDAC